MVFEEITDEMIEEICEDLESYDKTGFLPSEKTRIDITISQKAFEKIKFLNRSKLINDLILASS